MPLDPRFEEAIRARLGTSAFVRWMGIELGALDEGSCELRLRLQPHHLNPGNIAHGGVVATLLDGAIGLALRTRLGMDATHVTIHLDVQYLSPASDGTLIAQANCVHQGSRTAYGEADLRTEDGRLVARGSATFLIVRGTD